MKTKTSDKNQLMEQLAQHGYTLLQPRPAIPGEKLLVSVLEQEDVRLLEGFPVVLANLLREKQTLEWEKKWKPSDNLTSKTEHRLAVMLAMSHLLFKLFGLEKRYSPRVLKVLFRFKDGMKLLEALTEPFLKSQPVKMDGLMLSTERLKNNFRNYVVHQEESEVVKKKRQALELDLLLSELFTARQKELLNKRMQDKPLTKTEREYFYRVVKKRLKALANVELHQMARNLVSN